MSRGAAVWGKKLGAEGMGTASALDSVGLFPVWPVTACLQISLGLCKKTDPHAPPHLLNLSLGPRQECMVLTSPQVVVL